MNLTVNRADALVDEALTGADGLEDLARMLRRAAATPAAVPPGDPRRGDLVVLSSAVAPFLASVRGQGWQSEDRERPEAGPRPVPALRLAGARQARRGGQGHRRGTVREVRGEPDQARGAAPAERTPAGWGRLGAEVEADVNAY